MFREEEKYNPYSPREVAKTGLKELIFYAFGAVSAIITVMIAINIWSWWPFAGLAVVVFAFGFLLEYLIPDNKSFSGQMLSGEKAKSPPSDKKS